MIASAKAPGSLHGRVECSSRLYLWLRYLISEGVVLAEARVMELERKVDTIMKGLNVLLFEEGEAFPSEELEELKARLDDYLKGRRSEFVMLDEQQKNV